MCISAWVFAVGNRDLLGRAQSVQKRSRRTVRWRAGVSADGDKLNVLVLGSGGREHALADSISRSPRCSKVFAAPGNAGMTDVAETVAVKSVEDADEVVRVAESLGVDLVVVGPEASLVAGVVDRLQQNSIAAFGPSQAASVLEGSKSFMKGFLKRHNIPSAWYEEFSDPDLAKKFIAEKGAPIVIKADGLAAGKGVILASTVEEANQAVDDMLIEKVFGAAGEKIVIEEFLSGEEASFFAILDGETALPLASAQDHKAAYDGDKGPNTGGMGAYSPAPICTPDVERELMDSIVLPTARGMVAEGLPFTGVLFCGMMFTAEGPKVLEYNIRFGDPECQVLCMRLGSDLLEVLDRVSRGQLSSLDALQWSPKSAMVVVMASEGYPGKYKKGTVIRNIDEANQQEGVRVFHAGTAFKDDQLVSNGGRVLGVTATGKDIKDAQQAAYDAVRVIDWPEGFYRTDIGWRALSRSS